MGRMTREQAVKILKPIRDTYVDHANIAMTVEADNDADALEMAIEALEQPEIIRCDKCLYYKPMSNHWGKCGAHSNQTCQICDYCSWAERRTDE